MSRLHREVYKNRNTPIEIPLQYKGAQIDFVALKVTKVGIVINGVEYDSDGGYVDFTSPDGMIILKLGSVPNPPKGKVSTRVVIYTTDYPLGYVIFSEKTDNRLTLEFV